MRAKTKEEVRDEFMAHIRTLARYWAKQNRTKEDMCFGLLHSILVIFDGASAALPAFDIVLKPHPDDKEFYIEEGENWYEDGMVINDDVHLHDMLYKENL